MDDDDDGKIHRFQKTAEDMLSHFHNYFITNPPESLQQNSARLRRLSRLKRLAIPSAPAVFAIRAVLSMLILSSIFSLRTAHAFDIFPEFHALSELEQSGFDDVARIDSEYQSDVITYLHPLSWDPVFFSRPQAFDFTLGSLSSKLFLQQSRLRVRKRVLPRLDFRFTYFTQRDLDVDQTRAIIELTHELSKRFSLSLYGEPSHFKRENDAGIAVLYRPADAHEIRAFHTWVDFTRQEHNDRGDFFTEGKEPTSYGFVGRCFDCLKLFSDSDGIQRSWLEYFARRETPTEWHFPDADAIYGYELWTAGLKARIEANVNTKTLAANLRLQFSRKYESRRSISEAAEFAERTVDRRLIESLGSIEIPIGSVLGRMATFEPGVGWFHRFYRERDGMFLEHRNLLPHAWIHMRGMERAQGQFDSLSLGYEVTFFRSEGVPDPGARELKAWAAEHRVNFRYAFALEDDALLTLALTFDPDSVARRESGFFEGGNGQFRVFF